ncbi:MAG: hypothetical protein ACK5DE_12200 [Bacteroidota bacterium]|jgi:hypothetical protein
MAAATAAIVSITATAATTGFSFAQARKQRQLQVQAETKAAEMMADARKKLDVNFYQQLAIQKEPYELERQALISAGAQAIEAGVESERGAAATAGRVQMAQQAGQRDIATAMGQEMLGLEKLTAEEESRLRDLQTQLNLEEAAGAQMAAAQASDAANIANRQAVEGVISMGQQAAAAAPLYMRDRNAEMAAMSQLKFDTEQMKAFGNVAEYEGSPFGPQGQGDFTNLDFSQIGNMSKSQYNQFMKALTPQQRRMIMFNPQYTKMYNQYSGLDFFDYTNNQNK